MEVKNENLKIGIDFKNKELILFEPYEVEDLIIFIDANKLNNFRIVQENHFFSEEIIIETEE